jgi:hypothetical protein
MNTTHGRAKILLIAFDGLSFPLVQKWVAAGELPAMKRLMERGCYGLCKSFTPSNSAVIWTSVMTGMSPRKHGIDSFIYYKIGERILKKTAVKKLLKCGFRPLFKWFRKKGYIRDVPFYRKTKALVLLTGGTAGRLLQFPDLSFQTGCTIGA